MKNGTVTRRCNGRRNKELLTSMGFVECEPPPRVKSDNRRQRYPGR
jgi:hypothetical protein